MNSHGSPKVIGAKSLTRRAPRRFRSKKVCPFSIDPALPIDYKAIMVLRKFMSDRAKILPRRRTGVCAKYQRKLANAIKRARFMALLQYVRG